MLKLIGRILEPTSGQVHVEGRVSALIELGAGFHPDLTGRENIFLNGALLGLSRSEMQERYDEVVEFSELGRFIDVSAQATLASRVEEEDHAQWLVDTMLARVGRR